MRSALPSCAYQRTRTQRGSVIIFILLGIALFAALCYAFMKGMRGGTGSFNAQQAKLAAQHIIEYSNTFERTTNKLLSKGCSETEIAYYKAGNPKFVRYLHTPPSRDECNIISAEGGNLSIPTFYEDGYLDTNLDQWSDYVGGDLMYFWVDGIGKTDGTNSSRDLAFWVRGVKKEICLEINKQLGISPDLTQELYISVKPYAGVFDDPTVTTLTGDFKKTYAGCYQYGISGGIREWDFYRIIIER